MPPFPVLTPNPAGIKPSPMTNITNLTTGQLNQIIAIKEQIEALQAQIESIAAEESGGGDDPVPFAVTKRRRSPAVRARMAAAQQARWARIRGTARKGKRRLSAAGRAAIIAATKARWAKAKASNKKDRRSSPAVRAKLAAAAKARWAKARAEGKTRL